MTGRRETAKQQRRQRGSGGSGGSGGRDGCGGHATAHQMKARDVVLALLILQTTSIVLLMHYSRTVPRPPNAGPMYLSSAAVFMAEVLKLPFCLGMAAWTCGGSGELRRLLGAELFGEGAGDTLRCAVPALAYTLQGNLLFVALSNLEPPMFQTAYQTKTLFTALFAVCILGKRLVRSQWIALLLLFAGNSPHHPAAPTHIP